MSRRVARIALPVAALFATAGGVATAGDHEAAGPRQPVVAVERTADGRFDVAVSVLAVTSFDEAKNELENRRLARRLAEWGLWRELGAPTNRILSVSGLSPVSFEIADGRVEAEFSVPTNGVSLAVPPANAPESTMPVFPHPLDLDAPANALPVPVGFGPDPFVETNGTENLSMPTFDSTAGIASPTNFIAPLFPAP